MRSKKRMKYTGALALGSLLVASTGCEPKKGTASPEDYFPLVLVTFDGGKTAAMIGRNEFIKKKDFAGCVSMEALIAAFDGAGDTLAGKLADKVVIPGFELDLTDCMALRSEDEQPEGNAEVGPIIEGAAGVALATAEFYANRLKDANCKKGTAALGAIAYIRGLVDPVVKQVADPGSPLVIEAVAIDLTACE